jgi:hypothetical protein
VRNSDPRWQILPLRARPHGLVTGRCLSRSYGREYGTLSLTTQEGTMVQGSSAKIYKKSAAFWQHGKHKGTLHGILRKGHERPEKPTPPMSDPQEFFAWLRKKRKQG